MTIWRPHARPLHGLDVWISQRPRLKSGRAKMWCKASNEDHGDCVSLWVWRARFQRPNFGSHQLKSRTLYNSVTEYFVIMIGMLLIPTYHYTFNILFTNIPLYNDDDWSVTLLGCCLQWQMTGESHLGVVSCGTWSNWSLKQGAWS